MGLEIVELIMGIEEEFGIAIPDREAEKLETVGAIYAYVWNQVRLRQTLPCPSLTAFHRLRRSLLAWGGLERRSIRPAMRLADLLPPRDRQAHWEDLSRLLGRQLPELEWPRPVPGLILAGTGLLLALSCFEYLAGHHDCGAFSLTGSALFAWGASKWAAPFAVLIPMSCATVGDVVRVVRTPGPNGQRWTEPDVWDALQKVIVEQLDVKPEDVTPDAHLVYDLGAD